MIGTMKVIVTSAKEGKNYDYLNLVDLANGAVFSVTVPKGSTGDVPKLKPVKIVFQGRLTKYGLMMEQYNLEDEKPEGGEK